LETLRFQHERGRELIRGIGEAMPGYVAKEAMKTAELLEKMAAYAALLRHHIHIEDHIFYPMARKALTADEMTQVGEEFTVQRDKHGADAFERSHKLVVDMGSIITHLS